MDIIIYESQEETVIEDMIPILITTSEPIIKEEVIDNTEPVVE